MYTRTKSKLIRGVGINDADYVVSKADGWKCPFYKVWQSMIDRCYSERIQNLYPTYRGCSVCKDWLTFSKFKYWMEKQDWEGNRLDKDIIKPSNKYYCPDFCCFISHQLNTMLLNSHKNKENGLPPGVSVDERLSKKYRVCMWADGVQTKEEGFSDLTKAKEHYAKLKSDHILSKVENEKDVRVKEGLKLHAKIILSGKTA